MFVVIDAAEHDVDPEIEVSSKRLGVVRDLDSQFAGRGDYQRARHLGWACPWVFQDVGEDRQQVGGCFPRTGLSLRHNVLADEGQRQDLGLDLGQLGEAEFIDRLTQRFGKIDVIKGDRGKKLAVACRRQMS